MQQISGPIFEDKVIDFILEMATVTEVVVDKESLYKESDEVSSNQSESSKKAVNKKASSTKSASKSTSVKR